MDETSGMFQPCFWEIYSCLQIMNPETNNIRAFNLLQHDFISQAQKWDLYEKYVYFYQ